MDIARLHAPYSDWGDTLYKPDQQWEVDVCGHIQSWCRRISQSGLGWTAKIGTVKQDYRRIVWSPYSMASPWLTIYREQL